VAAGIRRIEAVTGRGAYERLLETEDGLERVSRRLNVVPAELERRVSALLEERDRLETAAAGQRQEGAAAQAERLIADGVEVADGILAHGRVELPVGTDLGEFGDLVRSELDERGSGAAIAHVTFSDDERQAFLSVVTDDWIRRGVHAGELVRVASTATGSKGGGRPHFAQGGVGDAGKVLGALEQAGAETIRKLDGKD
jgi:alanyl-tRNA synthetase